MRAAIHRQTVPLNGAEWLDLDARSTEAGLTMPAYIRSCCGLNAWVERGREMAERSRTTGRKPTLALERRSVTIRLTGEERDRLEAEALEAGASLAQYIRSRCGLQVRTTSMPGTEERDREEDDAWERLKRLGLEPQGYFPPDA